MEIVEIRHLSVTGPSSGPWPLTWGQGGMWDAYTALGPAASRYTMWRCIVPSRELSLLNALQSLNRTLQGVDAVRLSYDCVGGRQFFAPEARVPVYVAVCRTPSNAREPDLSRAAVSLFTPVLVSPPFGFDDPPIRIGIVCRSGKVIQIWFALSHLPFDGGALTALENAFVAGLEDRVHAASAPSTLELIHHESSPEMVSRSDERIRRWVESATRMSPGPGLRSMSAGEFTVTRLRSVSAGAATNRIAARAGVSNTSVVLSATTAVFQERSQDTLEAILFVCNNRVDRALRNFIGQTIGNGLVFIPPISTLDWDSYTRAIYGDTLRAYRSARYDNLKWRETMVEISRNGKSGDLSYYFNDVRNNRRSWEHSAVAREDFLRRDATVEHVETLNMGDATMFANLANDGEALVLQLTCDSSVISPQSAADALYAIDDLLHAKA